MHAAKKFTFTSIHAGRAWGQAPSTGAYEQLREESELTKRIKRIAEDMYREKMTGPDVKRAYLDLLSAAEALQDASQGGSELDIGLCPPMKFKGASTATWACFVLSFLVSAAFVGVAVLLSVWGIHVHGSPTLNLTALETYANGVSLGYENVTCSVEAQDTFELDTFLGWPDERVFWNLYGGLVLGLVFGFLDNFGLFYGMSALDSFFYAFGRRVAAGLMSLFGRPRDDRITLELHEVTNDLMAGLGNTFSDLLGVALGTAALEIAKAGLSTSPAFWILDLVAIVLGCLLGCFMPVLLKHKEKLGAKWSHGYIAGVAWVSILGLFVAVLLAGVPYEEAHVASFVVLCLNIVLLVSMLVVTSCMAGGVLRHSEQFLAFIPPDPRARQLRGA